MKTFKILSVLIVFSLFSTPGFSLRLEKLPKRDAAPKIGLISPKKDQTIDNPNIVIVAKITDDKAVFSVRVNGRLINIVPGTEIKIQEPMTLQEGKNVISIEAMDNTGQATNLTREIQYSSQSKKVFTTTQSVSEIKRVGEPLKIAVLSFGSLSKSSQLEQMGNIIAEMLTTSLGKTKRFDLMERGQLQKVMLEQGFSQSGFVDEETAKKIGKLIAVDLLITGTFSELTDSLRIDLRAIDTETGEIVYTEGLQSKGKSTDDLNLATAEIAEKVRQAFPLLDGKIIMVKDENSYLIDLGKEKSTTQGLRLVVYREGEDIVIDGVNYGKEIKVLGEIITVDVQDKYSICKLVKHKIPEGLKQGDKVVSK